jgi:hypothetical protein
MGIENDSDTAVLTVTCPSCGEVYDTASRIQAVLRNNGFCVNLTCLEDLSREPLDELLSQRKGTRRFSDRR